MMKKYIVWAALALTAALPSCRKDEPLQPVDPQTELFVPRGEVIDLALEGDTEDFRALTFETATGAPKLKAFTPGSKVRVLCVFRKLGDEASTTYKELDWTVDATGRKIVYRGSVTLANGSMKQVDNGKWYMMGIVGGTPESVTTVDAPTKAKVGFESISLSPAANNEISLDVPYILGWTALDVTEDAYGENKGLVFSRQGAILKYRVRNGMVDAYKVSKVYVETNAFDARGAFKLSGITDEMLTTGALPVWENAETQTTYVNVEERDVRKTSAGLWSMPLWAVTQTEPFVEVPEAHRNHITYTLATEQTIASATEGEELYTWVMPFETADQAFIPLTYVYADVQAGVSGAHKAVAVPIFKTAALPERGKYHSLYPEITSDLVIRNVFADYKDEDSSVAGSNGVGGVGVGRPPAMNLSAVVLYNPTLYPIDLAEYALVRGGYFYGSDGYNDPDGAGYPFFRGASQRNSAKHISGFALPLLAAVGDHMPFVSHFSTWDAQLRGDYSDVDEGSTFDKNKRYRVLAGDKPALTDGKLLLYPGRSAVFVGGGFLMEQDDADAEQIVGVLRQAVARGYCQFAVAYSDGMKAYDGFHTDAYGQQAGTLDLGSGQGMLLVRHTDNFFRVVDASIPYRPAYAGSRQYGADLRYFFDHSSVAGRVETLRSHLYSRHAGSNHALVRSLQYPTSTNAYGHLWTVSKHDDYEVYKRLVTPSGVDVTTAPDFAPPAAPTWGEAGRWVTRRES